MDDAKDEAKAAALAQEETLMHKIHDYQGKAYDVRS
jgi:hypothetical protein